MSKGTYIGVEKFDKRNLPTGYTQVEYIQSSGTQYINTDFKPNNASRIAMDIDVTVSSNQSALFGVRNDSGSGGFNVWTWNDNNGYQVDYGTQQFTGVGGKSSGRHILDLHQHVFYVDVNPVNIATTQSFSCSYNAYLFTVSSGGNLMTNYPCSAKLYACNIYDNGTMVRDFVPCVNPSGDVGLYDMVNGKFYANEGTGTFTAGASVHSSVARKIKKGYIGVNSVARKIKKAYIGIGGVARPCWSSVRLTYYGPTTEGLDKEVSSATAATAGNTLAIFCGGNTGRNNGLPTVVSYNRSLTKSTIGTLKGADESHYSHTPVSFQQYAMFAGGDSLTADFFEEEPKQVYVYDSEGSGISGVEIYQGVYNIKGTSTEHLAYYAGGEYYSSSGNMHYSNRLNVFSSSLTCSVVRLYDMVNNQEDRTSAAASVSDFAIFSVPMYYGTFVYKGTSRISTIGIGNPNLSGYTKNHAVFGWQSKNTLRVIDSTLSYQDISCPGNTVSSLIPIEGCLLVRNDEVGTDYLLTESLTLEQVDSLVSEPLNGSTALGNYLFVGARELGADKSSKVDVYILDL